MRGEPLGTLAIAASSRAAEKTAARAPPTELRQKSASRVARFGTRLNCVDDPILRRATECARDCAGMATMFPAKARTGVDCWRSPINGALGYMPEYTEHAKENPIEIVIGDRLLTDEEIEREAAFLRFRNALLADEMVDNGVYNGRETIHAAFQEVQDLKKCMRELEASFKEKSQGS